MYLLQDSDRLGLTEKKNPQCDVGFSQIFSPVILSFHLFSYIFTQGYNSYMMGYGTGNIILNFLPSKFKEAAISNFFFKYSVPYHIPPKYNPAFSGLDFG